jgi:SAM-dependent methyltransferase
MHPQWLLAPRRSEAEWLAPHLVGTVVDVGCGDRWLEGHIGPHAHYIGLDSVSTGAVLYGARPTVFGDAASLPFQDGSVDCVVFLEVLEHLEHPRQAIGEIARILKPGGRVLLSMPFLYPIHDAPYDFQRFTIHGLAREISAVGLELEQQNSVRHALETAGLLAAIGCAGVAIESLRHRRQSLVLLPFVLAAVPLINVMAWIAARLLPDWPALTSGYRVRATKPK